MLVETIAAWFFLACLMVFFLINVYNILLHKPVDKASPHAKVDNPCGAILGLVALGTTAYFVEATFYPLLVLANLASFLRVFTFAVSNMLMTYAQILGLLLTAFGYSLFLWSVIARGKYATSRTMRGNHRLVTWGPYRYVRNPSYTAYFAMFTGLFAVWPSLLSLIPLVGIPGYFSVTFQEEKLLERHCGEEYLKYQTKTGRFFPKLKVRVEEEQEHRRVPP